MSSLIPPVKPPSYAQSTHLALRSSFVLLAGLVPLIQYQCGRRYRPLMCTKGF